MNTSCSRKIFAIAMFFLLSSCSDQIVNSPIDDIPNYLDLDTIEVATSFQLDVPLRSSVPGFCYLESFSMQIAYLKPEWSRARVFAYALLGAGVEWHEYGGLLKPHIAYSTEDSELSRALDNLGVDFIVGSGSEMGFANITKHAVGKILFADSIEALLYLRRAICSGRPVQVHIDLTEITAPPNYHPYYVYGDASGGSSHFICVTGYNDSTIFLNETSTDQDPKDGYSDSASVKAFPVPLDVFMKAWRDGADINVGTDEQTGPYWMMIPLQNEGSKITSRKTPSEILSLHKSRALKNYSEIVNNLENLKNSSDTRFVYGQIAFIREIFADFLTEYQHCDSLAPQYRDLAENYRILSNCEEGQSGLEKQKNELENVIAPKEKALANMLQLCH